VKQIRRATRRRFSAEEKIRIVLSGLRDEDSIAELGRRERIIQNLYYRWSKEFLEAGKKRLAGDTARAAEPSDEFKELRREASALKDVVAELTLPTAGAPHAGETRHSRLPSTGWYDRYSRGGPEALRRPPAATRSCLEPHSGRRARQRHRAGARRAGAVAARAGGRFTDSQRYFVSEASVYRLLRAHDLIASPAFIVIRRPMRSRTPPPNQWWQTDFTYLKVIGWAGSTCQPCSTTSRATLLPGSSALVGGRCQRHSRSGIAGQWPRPGQPNRATTASVRQRFQLHCGRPLAKRLNPHHQT